MTAEEKQVELKRHRDIILATIDYLLEKTAGLLIFDGFDYNAQYYQKLKQKTERNYQMGRLERLQKWLFDLTEVPHITGDFSFDSYIKEKTGDDIDIFGNIQERVNKIIAQKRIKNKNEQRDVRAMFSICRQAPANQEKADILLNLLNDFDERRNKQKPSKEENHFRNQLSEIYSPDKKRKLRVWEYSNYKDCSVTQVDIVFETAGASVYGVNGINLSVKAYWKDNNTIVIETKKDYEVITRECQQLQSFNDVVKVEYAES